MTMTAHSGKSGELAGVLLRVAERLRGFPGCEIYLISHAGRRPRPPLERAEAVGAAATLQP
ncbi:hypothetical protein [Streptomyces sp. NPDC096132]|uniref:hypothetical protein n=1 Tax=Streptomyces sp. NPDC096132 TaxID=3366075 RepID=UPI00381B7E0C